MSLLERIVADPDVVHGRPRVRGTRMRVSDVLSLLAAGVPEAEILEDYPYLIADDIRACLEYAATVLSHARGSRFDAADTAIDPCALVGKLRSSGLPPGKG
jgi:uncharacterized protein (DUF433 family)